ncbi:hypothetical protein FDJ70_09400 [Clostridium botulinum]|uniref:Uncharacterized protein n=1 Tax=Clostridium botulinum D str. 1873 TaxID=592027 RepID=A0A9P2G6U5_CLOBO|nr:MULTISPECIES: hypothetical protein [Clostridium]EES91052.1 hypothetical protein CLG_B0714 [Clostridium botulinum D str. 1873]MBO3441630.1 hypothetical protein [Clostridium haemolyticum]NFV47872.1 hypothetical protein [Clostridium botulinum]QPW54878.1 hypothetical protein IRP61_06370 [Clostridium botulinum]
MFKCCCQCFKNPSQENQGPCVYILNQTHIPIYFILQYIIDVRTFTKRSPVFGFGQSHQIRFSSLAINPCFNVLNNSTDPPGFICNVCNIFPVQNRYKLIETIAGPKLIQIYP